jgi:putative thiamine transport system ATP-binding protein
MADGLVLDKVTIALGGTDLMLLSARVANGEVLTIMGPSGSGKSSLLSYIVGFLDPAFTASGSVFVNGIDLMSLPPEERHSGILFQDPLLFPHMSIGGNLAFALSPLIKGKVERRRQCEAAMDDIGLGGFYNRDPATLSGGQKARVALARVLLSGPRMLLLDEPFSKLDHELKAQMRELVFGKARAAGLPVILVTHDPSDAEAAGGQVIRIGT